MNEGLRFYMDETARPYEPGDPEYEMAVRETPESLKFEEDLIKRFGLYDKEPMENKTFESNICHSDTRKTQTLVV